MAKRGVARRRARSRRGFRRGRGRDGALGAYRRVSGTGASRRWGRGGDAVPGANRREGSDKRAMTRRSFVVGAACIAGLLLWNPRSAFAAEPVWDGRYVFRGYGTHYPNQFWSEIGKLEGHGAALGEVMYTDRSIEAYTPWVEWDISSNQYIRVATRIEMKCDFTTELYYHLTGVLQIACGSYNARNKNYNLWHTWSGDDTRFSLYHRADGQPSDGELEESKVVVIDNEQGEGLHKTEWHIWTDYREYADPYYDVWVRRRDVTSIHAYQLRSWFWNYYYYGKNWYGKACRDDPPMGFSTKWIEMQADRIYINSSPVWCGRVVRISPAQRRDGYLDVGSANQSSGAEVVIWGDTETTNQNWIIEPTSCAEAKGTVKLVPVHTGHGNLVLDQAGGGPTRNPSQAQLWEGLSNRAQSFWLHESGGVWWMFADCSGMPLECLDGLYDNGVRAWFNSNGYPGEEWGLAHRQWKIEDVRFGTNDGSNLALSGSIRNSRGVLGGTVGIPDLQEVCRPREHTGSSGATQGMIRTCEWLVTAVDEPWVREAPEVVGVATFTDGTVLGEQPGESLIGAIGIGKELSSISLSVTGTSLSGSVELQRWGSGAQKRIQLRLTGDLQCHYHITYRVYNDDIGWSDTVADGKWAGWLNRETSALQVTLRHKDIVASGEDLRSFTLDKDYNEKFVTCIVRARTRYSNVPYRGHAATRTLAVGEPKATIRYYVDGSSSPCWEDKASRGEAYHVASDAQSAARNSSCSSFRGWYTDASCTRPFTSGTIVDNDISLYGRNVAKVHFAYTTPTLALFAQKELFLDEDMLVVASDIDFLGGDQSIDFGKRLNIGVCPSVWYQDFGEPREARSVRGAFTNADEDGAAVYSMTVTGDVTLYRAWRAPDFDGIEVS